jgi:hypothetical protein
LRPAQLALVGVRQAGADPAPPMQGRPATA